MAGGKSDYLENKMLDHRYGGGDYTRPATVYLSLFSVAPSDAGGGTELTVAGYTRVAVTNNSTNFPAASGGSKSNGTTIGPFGPFTAAGPNAVAFGIFDASTSGNLLDWGDLLGAAKSFTAVASTDVITSTAHGFSDGTPVKFEAAAGAVLPTGVSAGTTYYVRDSTTNTFKVAATLGGSAVDLTADGGGSVRADYSQPVSLGASLSFPAGTLVITED